MGRRRLAPTASVAGPRSAFGTGFSREAVATIGRRGHIDLLRRSLSRGKSAVVTSPTDNAVLEASAGSDAKGTGYQGKAAIARALRGVFEQFDDARWKNPAHFVAGDRRSASGSSPARDVTEQQSKYTAEIHCP